MVCAVASQFDVWSVCKFSFNSIVNDPCGIDVRNFFSCSDNNIHFISHFVTFLGLHYISQCQVRRQAACVACGSGINCRSCCTRKADSGFDTASARYRVHMSITGKIMLMGYCSALSVNCIRITSTRNKFISQIWRAVVTVAQYES